MGYFLNKFGIKPFNEAEADGQELSDPNTPPADYVDEPPAEPAGAENTQSEQPIEEPPMEGGGDVPPEEATTDYTEDIGDIEGGGEEAGMDAGGNEEPAAEEEPVDELKQQEEDLLQLSPTELDIKHKELKSQFLSMYDITTNLIDRIGDTSVSEENIGVVEYISDTLARLRTILSDYVEFVYSTKSYTENSINYNRFLIVLNGINKLLEEMGKKEDN